MHFFDFLGMAEKVTNLVTFNEFIRQRFGRPMDKCGINDPVLQEQAWKALAEAVDEAFPVFKVDRKYLFIFCFEILHCIDLFYF